MNAPNTNTGNAFTRTIKKYFIAGVLVWLPIIVTIWILSFIIGTTDRLVSFLPQKWQPETYLGVHIPGLDFLMALIILFITGILAANVLGRKILEGWDSLLGRIPVVKSIYSGAKKVSESLFSDNSRSFKTPVLVPFPQPNIWTIAFISGSLPQTANERLPDNEGYTPVYVPTTPNPTGGYYIMVKNSDIRELNMSVDDALKYIISLGMVSPDDTPNTLPENK